MKRLLLISLLLFGCGQAHASESSPWTWEDTGLQVVYSGLLITDWAQTLHIARSKTNFCYNPQADSFLPYYEKHSETEKFIGKYPTERNVNVHFATSLIGHAAVSYLLSKPYRTIWQSVYIIYEYNAVQNNRDIGLEISFHF